MVDLPATHDWKEPGFASRWEALAEQVNPVRQEQLDLLLGLLRHEAPGTVLDLGVGSGLVAEMVLEALPEAQVVGLDSSPAMLDLARDRLARFPGRATMIEADLETVTVAACLAGPGPIHAVISVQTLHNLEPAAHRRMLASTAEAMAPGGMLVIADRYAAARELFGAFGVVWDRLGIDEGATFDEHREKLRAHGDRPVSLATELQWLDETGFDAACLQCLANRAVVVGRRRLQAL